MTVSSPSDAAWTAADSPATTSGRGGTDGVGGVALRLREWPLLGTRMDIVPIVAGVARFDGDPTGAGVSRWHNVLLAVLLFTAVALVGLGAGYLLSVAQGRPEGTPARRTTSSKPSVSASPTATPARPTVRSGSQIERGRTEDLGYLLGARRAANGLTHVAFDRVQLLRGDAAAKYAREHGMDAEAARSGLVVNENPRSRDLVLAPDVKVLGGVKLAASSDPEPVPLQTLLDALDAEGSSLPLELRYDKLGYVVQVTERRFG